MSVPSKYSTSFVLAYSVEFWQLIRVLTRAPISNRLQQRQVAGIAVFINGDISTLSDRQIDTILASSSTLRCFYLEESAIRECEFAQEDDKAGGLELYMAAPKPARGGIKPKSLVFRRGHGANQPLW